jgi:hypothetical protein
MYKAAAADSDLDRYIDKLLLRYFPAPTSLDLQSKTVVISPGSYAVIKAIARNGQTTIRLACATVIEQGLTGIGRDWIQAQTDARVLRCLLNGEPIPPGAILNQPPPPPLESRELEELLSYFTPRTGNEKGARGIRIPESFYTRLWLWARRLELPMAEALAIVLRRGMLDLIENWELRKRSHRIDMGKVLLAGKPKIV